ncbi:Tat pathway signal protein [Olivibacter sitiensis]|uniref:Tat pathway signal protein n=1 Tax=Olivibacter sitiensis TaxID=376470 RepID=UPI000486E4F3|nr:Tat pathway signal protein [Olivibacter sitiensis]
MNKREFLKTTLLGGTAAALMPLTTSAKKYGDEVKKKGKPKHWVWVNPDEKESDIDLEQRFSKWKGSGIVGVLFEEFSERHFARAKAAGLEAHRWMWTMNRGEKELLAAHPEWYSVSREGKSCATEPPYVGYYRFLCPSRQEVRTYLADKAEEQLSKKLVDGLHLDYIRFVDVILPVNLWENYKLDQSRELPAFDFCYCEVCKSKFKKETGQDIDQIVHPDQSLSWRNFRYRQITEVVNGLSLIAKKHKKPISAAVFPTPEVAKRIVRQDWCNWELNAIYPMIYHGFYKETIGWIGDAVKEGVNGLHGKFPLYAGLYLPDFKNPEEFGDAVKLALKNGAGGISIFGNPSDEILEQLG